MHPTQTAFTAGLDREHDDDSPSHATEEDAGAAALRQANGSKQPACQGKTTHVETEHP